MYDFTLKQCLYNTWNSFITARLYRTVGNVFSATTRYIIHFIDDISPSSGEHVQLVDGDPAVEVGAGVEGDPDLLDVDPLLQVEGLDLAGILRVELEDLVGAFSLYITLLAHKTPWTRLDLEVRRSEFRGHEVTEVHHVNDSLISWSERKTPFWMSSLTLKG